MNLRITRTGILAAIQLLVVWIVSGTGWLAAADERPPNVVVLFIDDMGYADPSCFGNPAMKTPNIDRLASEGIRLTNFYVNSPICSASRVALTTGQYQQRYRIHSYFATRKSNRDRKMPDWLDPSAPTLAKALQSVGYRTAHFGKWHMGGGRDVGDAPLPQAYGFDESLVSFEGLGDRILWQKTGNQKQSWEHGRGKILDLPKHKTTETYVDQAIRFIRASQDSPFYLRVFPNDVHDGHFPSDEQRAKWAGKSTNPPDNDFFAVLDEMDRQIGRLLDVIDELELAEKTLVIFTSDNGPTDWPRYYKQGHDPPGFTGPLFGRKWSLYEGGIRMPFIARWTGKIPAGSTDDSTLMAAIDVFPTLASIVGVEPSAETCDGFDMSRALMGTPISRPKPVFWEYGVHGSIKPGKPEHVSPNLAMRQGDWKLLCNPDESQLKLFDLSKDIGETQNLASRHPEIVGPMKSKLIAWWKEMNGYYAQEPLSIDFWYGDTQRFGHLGHPQRWINVLGHVSPATNLSSLQFDLNEDGPRSLNFDASPTRIAKSGDFNVEIARDQLRPGTNELTFIATDFSGKEHRRTATIVYIDDHKKWPLPYSIDWSKVSAIQEVAQIVDGHWKLTEQGVRTVHRHYDRVIAFGDDSWTDYEISTTVTVHALTGPRIPPNKTNVTHAAIALRWPGHDEDGKQPSIKWYPVGATGEFRLGDDLKECRWRIFDGKREFHVESDRRRTIEYGKPYQMKHRVETTPDGRSLYRVKFWAADEAEPSQWDLERIEPGDLKAGSALLIAHFSDVTFGNVHATSLKN